MAATSTYAYATGRFGQLAYGGLHPAVVTPSQDEIGVPFLVGNDRYQVIVCSDSGTSASAPSFRYWYAGGAPWGEKIALDTMNPQFYTTDENGAAVSGSLEFPFRELRLYRRSGFQSRTEQVEGVLIQFTPQPQAVESTIVGTTTVGFTVYVEAIGSNEYARTQGDGTLTGVAVSLVGTFSEAISSQPASPWPNTRTKYFPLRLGDRVRGARVIIAGIKLCEINRVELLGSITEAREV